jgi:hypothetical protein
LQTVYDNAALAGGRVHAGAPCRDGVSRDIERWEEGAKPRIPRDGLEPEDAGMYIAAAPLHAMDPMTA